MVDEVRGRPSYRPMPVLFNEDDHFDFDRPQNNMLAVLSRYASWGYFDPGQSDYQIGYQRPPVDWGINTEEKAVLRSAERSDGKPGTASAGRQ